ncbi:guanyl-nucleotide exchange factor [Ophiostoma piceae UAMH 11346]|uniref:Guanyl-nucleotide exchange factor n=1 Tax=Ophiostoma piceae (strain UAMH 11346) TaxID=1262450 RepID=S3DBH8_OPHP1|nr:guanyl-nucleotide exchange factor [Ophiostoma piceae UAMH 11346]
MNLSMCCRHEVTPSSPTSTPSTPSTPSPPCIELHSGLICIANVHTLASSYPEHTISSPQTQLYQPTRRPPPSTSSSVPPSHGPLLDDPPLLPASMSSLKFVAASLGVIAAAKDTSRDPVLADAVKKALEAIKNAEPQFPDPEIIFAPLQLATRSGSIPLTTTALDCIGKLISYSYFSIPSASAAAAASGAADSTSDGEDDQPNQQAQQNAAAAAAAAVAAGAAAGSDRAPLIERAIDTICDCFQGESTPAEVQLQIVNTANDGDGDDSSEAPMTPDGASASASTGPANGDGSGAAKLTLKDLEHRKSFDDSNLGDGPTMVTHLKRTAASSARSISEQTNPDSPHDDAPEALDAEDEVYIRDAYLVFRSFCNLSTKVLPPDQLYDLRGQPMRSKLVSLHLIHTLLNNNIAVFTSPLCTITNTKSNEPTSFLQAVKFYLCLSITRNGASSVDRVFEVCTEIFWLMLKFMRAPFKKEIEVFLNEIYLALLARKTAPMSQKLYFIGILNRFCADPRALVETYLNYDCERNVDNIFQTIIEHLSKLAITPVPVTSDIERAYEEKHGTTSGSDWQVKTSLPPPLTVSHIMPHHEPEPEFPKEYVMKRISLDALVESLRSMVNWSQAGRPDGAAAVATAAVDADRRASMDDIRESIDPDSVSRVDTPVMPATPVMDDDPEQLEREKARKTALSTAIKAFNFKPKRGLKMLLDQGFIASDTPVDIANFLVREDRLNKAQIGEYLGEGDPKNIETMHAFVNTMNFTKRRFVDALRQFLQSFRLPGEAQKIDRFMLKFAERYNDDNPNAFANADTAYVLAYSVIMLNTDLHSTQVVKRMTKQDFIRNNRGINDNADLPDEYLIGIYEEIGSNEIVLNSERAAAAAAGTLPPQQSTGLASAFSNVGRDLQREAYVQQSEEISLRSEQLFKNLFRSQRRNATKAGGVKFVPATSFKHIGPMFDVTWMSYFSSFSSQMQNAHNLEVNRLCLEGMKLATKIACQFELSTPREAFISALRNAANLNNVQELYAKNFEALRVLLELGYTEGNYLRESWKDILISVSQLERLQLMASGIDASSVPDVSKARFVPPSKERGGSISSNSERKSMQRRQQQQRPRAPTGPNGFSSLEIAYDLTSDDTIKTMDRIFTNTANLNGDAIGHFARALTEVSWDEIKVSGSNDNPRMYSLQKIVEISYYNMTRVRFEWTIIWDVLGDHFNKIGSHANEAVVFFALDSLRQLSMRFMEIEELAGFKFQKDFLKPFEHVMANSSNIHVKDMALRCLIQMIQARGENIRSGWRTMFGAFTVAARDPAESIVNMAFENVTQVFRTRFGVVIAQGAFTDLIVCLTEFSKNIRFQKKSLQAMETLKAVVPKMLKTPECPLSQQRPAANGSGAAAASDGSDTKQQPSRTSVEEGFWFPVLFAFHDVLMTGEDLEVRSNALNYFFETLLRYGGDFPPDFWDILWRQQLYPIFLVLRSRPEMSNVLSHEELSVWLSTTMIQALRNMITLFTHYFDALEYMLDRFLELLALCILQENDTIARIGSNCLQQLVLQNVNKFSGEHWSKIVGAFCELFERTTAYQLFSATTINSAASLAPAPGSMEFGYPLSPGLPPASDDEKSLKIGGGDNANGDVEASDAISTLSVPSTTVTAPEEDDSDDAEGSSNGDALRTPRAPSIISTDPTSQQPALEEFKPTSSLQQQPIVVTAARRRFFNRIISRCVLQLLMIETVNELFSNEVVYAQIPSAELLRLMALLKKSFLFARRFNNDKDLRMRLWREGFMKQPPNLLKQESGSAATYVAILFKMYADQSEERQAKRADVESALVPLCKDILQGYLALEDESQHRNIMAWRPVVVDVLEGYAHYFPEASFVEHLSGFYPSMIELLSRELSLELRTAIVQVLRRVGEVSLGIKGLVAGTHLTEGAGSISGEETFAQGIRRRRRGDSVMSMATTATANEGAATVDSEGGDASTKFMGRRMHSPSMQE